MKNHIYKELLGTFLVSANLDMLKISTLIWTVLHTVTNSSDYSLKKLIINYVTKFIFIYQYIRLDTFNAKVNVKEIICGEKWCTKFRLNVCFVYQRKE